MWPFGGADVDVASSTTHLFGDVALRGCLVYIEQCDARSNIDDDRTSGFSVLRFSVGGVTHLCC